MAIHHSRSAGFAESFLHFSDEMKYNEASDQSFIAEAFRVDRRRRSLIMLQAAVIMFSFSGVISRSLSVSSVTIACGRVICSSWILFILLKIKGASIGAKSKTDARLTIAAGIILAIHWTAFFQSIQVSSVAIGTITYATFPLFLIFIEPAVYHEKISVNNMIFSALLLIGVLITVPEFSLENGTTVGIAWGMLSSFTYAMLTLCNRKLSGSYPGMWVSFREQLVAAIVLLPLMIGKHDEMDAMNVVGILAIGVICTAMAFSLFVSAQKYVSAQSAGISAGMETVYGILFAMILLGESPSIREIVGGIIILVSALASSLSAGAQKTDV
jgi:drug/metabolite transporter (DMT)-like permease